MSYENDVYIIEIFPTMYRCEPLLFLLKSTGYGLGLSGYKIEMGSVFG